MGQKWTKNWQFSLDVDSFYSHIAFLSSVVIGFVVISIYPVVKSCMQMHTCEIWFQLLLQDLKSGLQGLKYMLWCGVKIMIAFIVPCVLCYCMIVAFPINKDNDGKMLILPWMLCLGLGCASYWYLWDN